MVGGVDSDVAQAVTGKIPAKIITRLMHKVDLSRITIFLLK
jgi:hypothetical protein